MVEKIFIDDLRERGVEVQRNTAFTRFEYMPERVRPMQITCLQNDTQITKRFGTRYLVGCDGAHSRVRKAIPDAVPIGASSDAVWGVLDGVLDTDFPDIWSKVVVQSEEFGSVLMIPRERNMTRLYIELKLGTQETTMSPDHTQEFMQQRAQDIMRPYRVNWRSVEWFSRYQIGQRIAAKFTDPKQNVFIAGDVRLSRSVSSNLANPYRLVTLILPKQPKE